MTPELEKASNEFFALVARLQITARFMERPIFMAQLCEAVQHGMARYASPWLDPHAAADWSMSSEGFVYQMAEEGIIKRYGGEGMPRFLKSEIDAAIREGRWQSAKTKKRRNV